MDALLPGYYRDARFVLKIVMRLAEAGCSSAVATLGRRSGTEKEGRHAVTGPIV